MSRRKFLGYAAAGAGLAGLAGCGGTSVGGGASSAGATQGPIDSKTYPLAEAESLNRVLHWPTAINEPSTPVTLSVAHTWTPDFWVRQMQFDKFFTERHPNIRLSAQNTPGADYQTKYSVQGASGGLPDVMYAQYTFAQNFIHAGRFVALDNYMKAQPDFNEGDFVGPALSFYQNNGSTYGLAYDVEPLIVVYNKDFFDKAGEPYPSPDWTMDDLLAKAKKVSSGSGGNRIFGFGTYPQLDVAYASPVFLQPFGARLLNPAQTACEVDNAAAVKAMDFWVNEFGPYAPTLSENQAITSAGVGAFIEGKAAMDIAGTWMTAVLHSETNIRFGYANWPAGPVAHTTASDGSCYAITTDCKERDAAWIYLNEYTSTAGLTFMFSTTGAGSPARASAWGAYQNYTGDVTGASYFLSALNSYATADGVSYKQQGVQITDAITPIWEKVWGGSLSVPAGLRQVQAAVTPIAAKNA
ncbi:MAG: sugar ABC transporter substrate-binding protein [Nocardiopsaceae bacterium]|nr:sugar ABC transporter substrate-binding protein [Nocardiopsaceae bacterium]